MPTHCILHQYTAYTTNTLHTLHWIMETLHFTGKLCIVQHTKRLIFNQSNFQLLTAHFIQNTAHFSLPTTHLILNNYKFKITLHTVPCTIRTAQLALQAPLCTLHTTHCTLRTENFTLRTAHCTLHTAHCTLLMDYGSQIVLLH